MTDKSHILVTGAAGFIGFHTAIRLLKLGKNVVGIDNVNAYYDVTLKEDRILLLEETAQRTNGTWKFIREDLVNHEMLNEVFNTYRFEKVIHLAAQAGVRHSLSHPRDYVQSNILAFTNILEASRHWGVSHLTYASTSSVYGANTNLPSKEDSIADHPLQFYAATKRANELMAHAYSHLFQLPTTGLRFFTVFGPWGRPDMAFFKFTRAILRGDPIDIYNYGSHSRDFTYIDDIVEGIIRSSENTAKSNPTWNSEQPDPSTSTAPFQIVNIGNGSPVQLMSYINALELALNKKAVKIYSGLQPGDAIDTHADVTKLNTLTGYSPATSLNVGIRKFVEWYREYYNC